MKILMILSNPLMVDPRVYKEIKALMEVGHEVSIIVWDRHHEYSPIEVIEGIKIIRIHNEGLMEIFPNDLLRNPIWWRKAYKKAMELYKNGYKFDVVHCHDLDTLQAGVWLKKKLNIKLIYDAHENFAYMIKEHVSHYIFKSAVKMEKKLTSYVDHIITVSPPLKNYLKTIANKPVTVVMNCKELINDKYIPPKNDIFTLIYIGVMIKERLFPDIVHAIGSLKNIRFVVGGKKEGLYWEVEKIAKNYGNIEFVGTVPLDKILPLTHAANAVLLPTRPPTNKYHQQTLFNKQFEAMVCGRPIIITKGTYAGKMIEKLKCGLTVEYNKEAIKEAIIKLRDNPKLCEELGRNAFMAAKERYNWEMEKKKLLKVYDGIV